MRVQRREPVAAIDHHVIAIRRRILRRDHGPDACGEHRRGRVPIEREVDPAVDVARPARCPEPVRHGRPRAERQGEPASRGRGRHFGGRRFGWRFGYRPFVTREIASADALPGPLPRDGRRYTPHRRWRFDHDLDWRRFDEQRHMLFDGLSRRGDHGQPGGGAEAQHQYASSQRYACHNPDDARHALERSTLPVDRSIPRGLQTRESTSVGQGRGKKSIRMWRGG